LFSTKKFTDASRKFVCIRIETYENNESEKLVKKVLHGELANTAFVILDPQGKQTLTKSGRSPRMAMVKDVRQTKGRRNELIIAQMNEIGKRFEPHTKPSTAELQDFHSLRQALNCASAEQRLLVFVNSSNKKRPAVEQKLKSVFGDKNIIGKFHLNFFDEKSDKNWTDVIEGAKDKPSIVVVRANQFGLKGDSLDQLALDASTQDIKKSLLAANSHFAKTEKRKHYEEHVRAGKRQRVFFENEIPKRGSGSREKKRGSDRDRR